MLAACGLDFVIFDMEHGRCDISLLAEMVASCRGSEIVPIARVPDAAYAPLSRALDVGARGVMVPRVESRKQAEDIKKTPISLPKLMARNPLSIQSIADSGEGGRNPGATP
jgi:2-keto-3-deoxy-L-rhamnonate aldolase RhmA